MESLLEALPLIHSNRSGDTHKHQQPIIMKSFVALLALVSVCSAGVLYPATTLLRTPSLDSAVIKSERLGGNFAYSSVEGHSYAAVAPVVSHVATPVAVSYQAHAPVVTSYSAHLAHPYAAHPYAAHPYTYAHPYGAYSPLHAKVLVA